MKVIRVPELPKGFTYMSKGYEIRGIGESLDEKKIENALSSANK
jgi:hypothetical protein